MVLLGINVGDLHENQNSPAGAGNRSVTVSCGSEISALDTSA